MLIKENTKKVSAAWLSLLGEWVSALTVSEVAKRLDEGRTDVMDGS